jgi:hypothetical protein
MGEMMPFLVTHLVSSQSGRAHRANETQAFLLQREAGKRMKGVNEGLQDAREAGFESFRGSPLKRII